MTKETLKRPYPGDAEDSGNEPDGPKTTSKRTVDGRVQTIPKRPNIGTEAQDIPLLEIHLYKVRMHRLQKSDQPIFISPMAKPNRQARDDTLFPLMDKVQEFLTSKREVMLILGDSGAGKSTFTHHLEHQLWTNYNQKFPIPLHISLSAFDRPEQDMIYKQLKIYDFNDEQILEMKQRRQFILICDGYDESHLTTNLHQRNLLNRPGQWSAKIIITCRSQYLSSDYIDHFVPLLGDHLSLQMFGLFQEAVITPFTKEQIQRYVDAYVPLESRPWVSEDYIHRLTTIPNLLDLVQNPFLLSIALDALPGVTEGKHDFTTISITRAQLYDIFVEHWIETNKRRLERSNLSEEGRKMLDQLKEAGFTYMGIDYCTRLARAIFDQQNGNPWVYYAHITNKDPWKIEFFEPEPRAQILKGACPLTRTGNFFGFIHRSILEYFFSRAIYSPIRIDDVFGPGTDGASFDAPLLDFNNPLFQYNLLAEPSILQFLCDRIKLSPEFEQQLRAIIDQSKTEVGATIAATNAITILVRAGISFHGADFRGAKIPGADLSDGQFDSVQFQGADLTGVNFSRSWLRMADMSGALLEGVRFGELECLEMDRVVLACTYSPKGGMLAVGLYTGQFEIFSTSDWKKIHQLKGHPHETRSLAFSPDSQRIVSGGEEKTIRVWDCSSGAQLLTLEGHTSSMNSVAYSPCGNMIASASKDRTVRLWDSRTGLNVFEWTGHLERVVSVKFSPDGKQLVSGDMKGTIRFWSAETGVPGDVWRPLKEEEEICKEEEICSLAFSPDGRLIASGHKSGALRLCDAGNRKPGPALHGHAKDVTGIAFSPDGKRFASSSEDSTVKLWDVASGSFMFAWNDHNTGVYDLAFSPNGLQIASGGFDLKVRLWEVNSWSKFEECGQVHQAQKLAYPPKNRSFLSAIDCSAADRSMRQWGQAAGSLETLMSEFPTIMSVESVVFSADGKHIAIGSNGRSIPLEDQVTDLDYSRCGRWGVSLVMNTVVQLRELCGDKKNHILLLRKKELAQIGDAAFSPTGNQLAIGSWNGTVWLFDPESKEKLTTKTLLQEQVLVLAYSPDGRQLALGSESRIYLWDLQSDTPGVLLNRGGSPICSLAYSPCGQWLTSGFENNTVLLWRRQPDEVESWSCVSTIRGFSGHVCDVVWNPVVPMEFVTGCKDGSVRVWQVSKRDEEGKDEGDGFCVTLVWGPNFGTLCVEGLVCQGASGLSLPYRKLLIQRGAVKSTVSLVADGEKAVVEEWMVGATTSV